MWNTFPFPKTHRKLMKLRVNEEILDNFYCSRCIPLLILNHFTVLITCYYNELIEKMYFFFFFAQDLAQKSLIENK